MTIKYRRKLKFSPEQIKYINRLICKKLLDKKCIDDYSYTPISAMYFDIKYSDVSNFINNRFIDYMEKKKLQL